MLVAYFLLLCLYIVLTMLYVLAPAKTVQIPPWPILPHPPEALQPVAAPCQTDSDCESHHVCLGGTCVRKLLRGGKCNPSTGRWISHLLDGAPFAICACLNPALYAQKFFGGDCDVNVACGIHGKYNPGTGACNCDAGYTSAGLVCQKLPAMQLPCDRDELKANLVQEGFDPDYVARRVTQCVKRPCSFDALTGRFLKHGRYEKDWGCVCDPRYGLFGVRLEGDGKKYLASPGFDACASIYKEDPEYPRSVRIVTYFYLGDREPVSVILFETAQEGYLNPLFYGRTNQFMVTQSAWRYDFAQHFFRDPASTFRAQIRKIFTTSRGMHINFVKHVEYVDPFEPRNCRDLLSLLRTNPDILLEYELLYASPVCKVVSDERFAHPMFRDRVVVNPHLLTYEHKGEDLPRFNAFILSFKGGVYNRWTLELGYEYKMDTYLSFKTNAPDWSAAPFP